MNQPTATATPPKSSTEPESCGGCARTCNLVVLGLAVVGTAGSLALTWGLDLKACPLCLYQRTFVMATLGVVAIGMATNICRSTLPVVLALPSAIGGLGVAMFHEYKEATGALECPAGLLGLGSAPQQSMAMFAILVVAMLMIAWRGRTTGDFGIAAIVGSVVVGGLLAAGTVKSAPPPCKPDYTKPLDGCRPPQPAT